MKISQKKQSPGPAAEDRLVPVLHRIARRADELQSRGECGHGQGRDLEYWLQAEREVFGPKIIYSSSANL